MLIAARKPHPIRVAAIALLLGITQLFSQSEAAVVVYNDVSARDFAIAINDLSVDGRTVNVDFVNGSFRHAFGDPASPTFELLFAQDLSAATTLATAISETLNSETPIALLSPDLVAVVFNLPFGLSEDQGRWSYLSINACAGSGSWYPTCGFRAPWDARDDRPQYANWAVARAVTEPATLSLFALGLFGLMATKKRRHVAVTLAGVVEGGIV